MTSVDGYITDVPYARSFIGELAPAWLDHVAIVSGYAPPPRHDGFAWCDLGCGQGTTATLLAATHPQGRFVGIDLMATHVDHARRFAIEAQTANASFHEADFAAACALDLPKFDYIVAHGVYSWVDHRVQQDLRAFIDRHLKPGGLAYISYNAMPGRGPDVALQYLLRSIAVTHPGDSIAQVTAAIPFLRRVADLKTPALVGSMVGADMEEDRDRFPVAYLAHEFMNARWKPLFVTEVRASMAEIGLTPVGSATLVQNHDSFVLGKAARGMLSEIEDGDLRELARDYFLDQSFRRDVFVRDGATLNDQERQDRLFDSTFGLARPAGDVAFNDTTAAGKLDFDNAFTRKIVAALATGPRRLADIVDDTSNRAGLLANLLVLCATGGVQPLEVRGVSVNAINRAICRRLDGPEELRHLALDHGTAVKLDRRLIRYFRDGGKIDGALASWRDFLAAHGVEQRAMSASVS